MITLLKSEFFRRFAGGFALGLVALVGMQPEAVKANLGLTPPATAQVG